jgi:hypothetical protein
MWIRTSSFGLLASSYLLLSFATCSYENGNAGAAGQTPADTSQQPATSSIATGGTAAVTGAVGASGSGSPPSGTGSTGNANSAGVVAGASAGAAASLDFGDF